VLLKEAGINVCKAGIGNIDKKDLISANTNLAKDELDAIILGFNVAREEDTREIMNDKIKIFEEDVVYKLIEKVQEYRHARRMEIEKEKMLKLSPVAKLKILHQFVFRNSNPCVFGVKVEGGKIRPGLSLMDEKGEEVAKIKNIQADKETIKEAGAGMEIAISLPGTNFERQLKEKEYLYSDISEGMFREFKKNKDLLARDEIDVLQKISQIMRAKKPSWGV
jgi:translation initiation factor 5B